MSKLCNADGRKDGGSGYTRALKNPDLGKLISRVQSTVISNGSELERLILERVNQIEDLNIFITRATNNEIVDGTYVCKKAIYRKSNYVVKNVNNKKIEPDLLIFIVQQQKICKIIELKDGDAFDTKKSNGERESLELFKDKFGSKIPFVAEYYICCFNQLDKNIIYDGFKHAFDMENILTGKELCDILGIDYDEIIDLRRADAEENFTYFLDQLLEIDEVKNYISNKLNN